MTEDAGRRDLTEQVLAAEQDERRRIALFLHDGPVQSLAGVALMLDAVGDFIRRQRSAAFGKVLPSYQPGVTLTDLAEPGNTSLPGDALDAIREAIPAFERQIPGFAMADAVLTGVESRTSSPLRITRGRDFQSLNVTGLYPAGEGAGYAGGIMSAAVDGIEVAEALGALMLARDPRALRAESDS